jgi:HNH endonuclease/NUMOD3 motif
MAKSHRGLTLSAETRAKLSAAKRGVPKSPEWRAKIAAAHRGMKATRAAKAKMAAAKRGRPNPGAAAASRMRTREKNGMWKGGHTIEGGRRYTTVPGRGKVRDARLVMEGVLGRRLLREEHVHHIDENKLNDDPFNLMLLSNSGHHKLHQAVKFWLKELA